MILARFVGTSADIRRMTALNYLLSLYHACIAWTKYYHTQSGGSAVHAVIPWGVLAIINGACKEGVGIAIIAYSEQAKDI